MDTQQLRGTLGDTRRIVFSFPETVPESFTLYLGHVLTAIDSTRLTTDSASGSPLVSNPSGLPAAGGGRVETLGDGPLSGGSTSPGTKKHGNE